MRTSEGWTGYVVGYHDANPGVTEDVLAAAMDCAGRNPYDWLLEAVPARSGTVVDLACGNGAVLRRCHAAAVGVDRSPGELARARCDCRQAPLVQADAAALPMASGVAGVVTVSMALMVLPPAELVLAEVARVLRPGGVLVATVPSREAKAAGFADILGSLGQTGVRYPEPLDDAASQLAASGLQLRDDVSATFARTVATRQDAELIVRSFYAPGGAEYRRPVAVLRLCRRLEAGPIELAYPLRRIVAVRSG